jgi:hypothetical protein
MPYRNPKDPANVDKARESRRAWYYRNKEKAKKRTRAHLADKKKWLAEYKATLKCEQCEESHPACLEFHHRDKDQKEITISQAICYAGWGVERVLEEIRKCQVLCANCHAKLHWHERQIEAA